MSGKDPLYEDIDFPKMPLFPEFSQEIKVNPKNSNAIQTALDAATFNSTIIIPAGTYNENIVIRKRVKIIGDGKVTITSPNHKDTITIDTSGVFLSSLKVTSGKNQAAAPVNLINGTAVFDKCLLQSKIVPAVLTHSNGTIFLANSALSSSEGPCIKLSGRVKAEIIHCVIAETQKCGIICSGKSQLKITDSQISKCGDSGIIALDDSYIFAQNTQITENEVNGIELCTVSPDNYIKNCRIDGHENGCGISCSGNGKCTVSKSQITKCVACISSNESFVVTTKGNTYANATTSAIVSATNGGQVNMWDDRLTGKSSAGLLATNSSQIMAHRTEISNLTGTGAVAYSSSLILLDECIISSSGEHCIEAQESEIRIRGSLIEKATQIGVLLKSESKCNAENSTFRNCGKSGFHVVDGSEGLVEVSQCFFKDGSVGASIKNSSPKFVRCEFSSDETGLDIRGSNSSPSISGCTFTQCKSVGANAVEECAPSFELCVFTQNPGGGLSAQNCKPTLDRCQFTENAGLSLCLYGGAQLMSVARCVFRDNAAFAAQLEQQGTYAGFVECEFHAQKASGAVMLNNMAMAAFSQCGFAENKNSHIEARGQSRVQAKGCEFFNSECGIGVMANGGIIQAEGCVVHDEKQSGIAAANGGTIQVVTCNITRCGVGVYLLQGSNGVIQKSQIHQSTCGIQIAGGTPIIDGNNISDNAGYGINVAAGAQPQLGQNKMSGNKKGDIGKS